MSDLSGPLFKTAVGWGGAILTSSNLFSAEPAIPPAESKEISVPSGSSGEPSLAPVMARSSSLSSALREWYVAPGQAKAPGDSVPTRGEEVPLGVLASGTRFPAEAGDDLNLSKASLPLFDRNSVRENATHTTFGGNALRRFAANRNYQRYSENWSTASPLAQQILIEKRSEVQTRHLFGIAEATVKSISESGELKSDSAVGAGVDALNDLFKGVAEAEKGLKLRNGVILDLFGEVRRDFSEFGRNLRQRGSGESLREIDDLSSFASLQGSDLPSRQRDIDFRSRVGLSGVTDPDRLKLSGRMELRVGTGVLKHSTLFLSGQWRPFADNEDTGSQRAKYSVFGGLKKDF